MQVAECDKQILIVEDEGLIAADIQQKLERLGYPPPAIASSGEEALRRARATPFDLVLMDIRLKGEMDGIATAQTLKSELEAPVIYITAHSDQHTLSRAKITEPYGYLLKPIRERELRSTVQISLYKHTMERRLRASEAWLSTTLRSVGEGIIATNLNGEVVLMNAVAERLAGCTAAEANGHPLMEVLTLFDEAAPVPAKNPTLELGKRRSYRLVSELGSVTVVEVESFENRTAEDVLGAIVVIRDLAERREAEARVMQSQRMQAIANLAGGLAHDFNNQLMVILGYAEGFIERFTGVDRQEALEIKQAASIAAAITGQLLTLSRRGVIHAEAVRLNDIIREVQPLLSRSLEKSRPLVTKLDSPGGVVRIDRNQLKQVLINLTLNARDAMPEGGEVHITTSIVEVEGDDPSYTCKSGSYVRLRFTDTGRGMDKPTLSRIFEPFFTTKEAGLGTGLGLAMVHSIIVQSGGSISASSEPGHGTTFEILLPCFGALRRYSEVTGTRDTRQDDSVPTILLVEDEDNVRRLMHQFLEREGFQLLEARNAEEAEALAEIYDGPIHMLVTDVVMPGMTGPALAERLKPLRPEMQVLYVSAYPHDSLGNTGIPSREHNLLPKPFSAALLLDRVQSLMRKSRRPVRQTGPGRGPAPS